MAAVGWVVRLENVRDRWEMERVADIESFVRNESLLVTIGKRETIEDRMAKER